MTNTIQSFPRSILVFTISIPALIFLPVSFAAEPVPSGSVAGKYGFGYGEKLKSRCAPISRKLAASFDRCEWEKVDLSSYTQKNNYYTCEIKKNGDEYKIFPSKARCLDELGIMNANAP